MKATLPYFHFAGFGGRVFFAISLAVSLIVCRAAGAEFRVTLSSNTVVFSWPEAFSNFVLQSTTQLQGENWNTQSAPMQVGEGRRQVAIELATTTRFFRLKAVDPCFECTQVIGFSQVGAPSGGWYVTDGVFESIVPDAKWQLLWNGGAGVDRWQDPNYSGWTNRLVSPCPVVSNAPTRVLLSISGPYASNEPAWADAIEATIHTVRAKLPAVKKIILQPVVGGPNHESCYNRDQLVRASWQQKHIDNAIEVVVTRLAGLEVEIISGFSPEVRTCDDYRDALGHLTRAGAIAAARAMGEYYKQLDSDCIKGEQ